MRRTDSNPELLLELKLVEVVGDLGSTLAREDIHTVVDNGHGEIATRRGAVPTLYDLLPLRLGAGEID